MAFEINPKYKTYEKELKSIFDSFETLGDDFILGERNKIKNFDLGNVRINVKSFKIPNKINQIVYKYFRKSKAKRSFEFAEILLSKGIGTPEPIGFQEFYQGLGLNKSFYASLQQDYDLTFRELVEIKNYPDEEEILRQFTRFCYKMHESGIEFKDHSPGNTLIKKDSNLDYSFYLVDLNRMKFHASMNLETRMKNLSRLTPKKEMVRVMADEYAKISGEDADQLFASLWRYTSKFQKKYHRKLKAKKKLKSFLN